MHSPASSTLAAMQERAWTELWRWLLSPSDDEPTPPETGADEPQPNDDQQAEEAA